MVGFFVTEVMVIWLVIILVIWLVIDLVIDLETGQDTVK